MPFTRGPGRRAREREARDAAVHIFATEDPVQPRGATWSIPFRLPRFRSVAAAVARHDHAGMIALLVCAGGRSCSGVTPPRAAKLRFRRLSSVGARRGRASDLTVLMSRSRRPCSARGGGVRVRQRARSSHDLVFASGWCRFESAIVRIGSAVQACPSAHGIGLPLTPS